MLEVEVKVQLFYAFLETRPSIKWLYYREMPKKEEGAEGRRQTHRERSKEKHGYCTDSCHIEEEKKSTEGEGGRGKVLRVSQSHFYFSSCSYSFHSRMSQQKEGKKQQREEREKINLPLLLPGIWREAFPPLLPLPFSLQRPACPNTLIGTRL